MPVFESRRLFFPWTLRINNSKKSPFETIKTFNIPKSLVLLYEEQMKRKKYHMFGSSGK